MQIPDNYQYDAASGLYYRQQIVFNEAGQPQKQVFWLNAETGLEQEAFYDLEIPPGFSPYGDNKLYYRNELATDPASGAQIQKVTYYELASGEFYEVDYPLDNPTEQPPYGGGQATVSGGYNSQGSPQAEQAYPDNASYMTQSPHTNLGYYETTPEEKKRNNRVIGIIVGVILLLICLPFVIITIWLSSLSDDPDYSQEFGTEVIINHDNNEIQEPQIDSTIPIIDGNNNQDIIIPHNDQVQLFITYDSPNRGDIVLKGLNLSDQYFISSDFAAANDIYGEYTMLYEWAINFYTDDAATEGYQVSLNYFGDAGYDHSISMQDLEADSWAFGLDFGYDYLDTLDYTFNYGADGNLYINFLDVHFDDESFNFEKVEEIVISTYEMGTSDYFEVEVIINERQPFSEDK